MLFFKIYLEIRSNVDRNEFNLGTFSDKVDQTWT